MDHLELIERGLELHEDFEYERALPYFEKAWEKDPMCPASIYNYANTLHMLGDEKEAGKRLEVLLSGDAAALESGCPDGCARLRRFRMDAYFLRYYIAFASSGSFSRALPFASEHLARRRRGVRSIWSRRQVIAQLKKDDPDPESKAVARIERQTRAI